MGIGVKTQSSTIIDQQADRVRTKAQREGLVRDVQPEEPKAVKKAVKKAVAKKSDDDGSEKTPVKKAAVKKAVAKKAVAKKAVAEKPSPDVSEPSSTADVVDAPKPAVAHAPVISSARPIKSPAPIARTAPVAQPAPATPAACARVPGPSAHWLVFGCVQRHRHALPDARDRKIAARQRCVRVLRLCCERALRRNRHESCAGRGGR